MDITAYLAPFRSALPEHRIDPALQHIAQEMRTSYRAMIPSAGVPDPVDYVENITIPTDQPDQRIPLRVYSPLGMDRSQKHPMVLFIHGGGWVSGDLDTHDVLVRAICNGVNAIVVSVDYRLAPEHPFPAGIEDVYRTLQWMTVQADSLGGDATRIAVAGDSAGGNLSAVLPLLVRDIGEFRLVASWLMYPEVSLKMDTESWRQFGDTLFPTRVINTAVLQAYVPQGVDRYQPLIAPLWGLHEHLPPTLIQVGEHDPLRDECLQYAEALSKAGVSVEALVYPKQEHGFIQFYKDKKQHTEGVAALNRGLLFLKEQLYS